MHWQMIQHMLALAYACLMLAAFQSCSHQLIPQPCNHTEMQNNWSQK